MGRMPKTWIDAEFEVVSGPMRAGDPHPLRKRWIYVGVDAHGRPLWYRPPHLNRYQFALAVVVAAFLGWVALIVVVVALHGLGVY